MKLFELKREIKGKLTCCGIRDDDQTVLAGLFEHAFNFSLNFILSEPQYEIDEKSAGLKVLYEDVEKLSAGMPFQYVTGKAWFCGHRFTVNENVLIPRMETEILVAHAADYVKRFIRACGRAPRVLDLCSGSGAIGISVKYLFPETDVTLSDVSPGALEVSKQNAAEILGGADRLTYVCGSFLAPFIEEKASGRPGFDIILSNPPYVPTEAIKRLPETVRNYEPRIALDGGPGGILPYSQIAKDVRGILNDISFALFEIGETQGNAVSSILRSAGFSNVKILRDLDNKDRFVKAIAVPSDFSESDGSFALIDAALRAFSVMDPALPEAPYEARAASGPEIKETPAARSAGEHAKKADPPLKTAAPPTKAAAQPAVKADSPVSMLKGVGPGISSSLAACGISTVEDLLRYFPLRYEDRTKLYTVSECRRELLSRGLTQGTFLLCLKISSVREKRSPGLPVTILYGEDPTDSAEIVFFNNKYVRRMIFAGRTYFFYGSVRLKEDLCRTVSVVQPKFVPENDPVKVRAFLTVSPVYRLKGSLRQQDIKKAVSKALALPGECYSSARDLPEGILSEYGLPRLEDAFRMIHAPASLREADAALYRFTFENMLDMVLCVKALKHLRESGEDQGIAFEPQDLSPLKDKLPFTLTAGQNKVIDTVVKDMSSVRPMNRLIDGDVGSGKTVIALYAIYNAVRNGFQAALMVPSTVLAEQHMKKTSPLLESLGVKTALLYSSTPAKERRRIEKEIACGGIDLVIGTHSLLNEALRFKAPGLFVIDEQHRFGVAQRAALAAKRGVYSAVPDVLSLSATPIPRSLALILYGDMDISVLDEKPAGRQSIETYLYGSSSLPRILERVRSAAENGSRVYMVYSRISEKDDKELADNGEAFGPQPEGAETGSRKGAVEAFNELSATVFRGIGTGLIHGRMKDTEKKAVMEAFASGDIQILFSTTVIEVGIDVPAANIIIINDAERFGLSTLHQLRGRVGRGSERSFCLMVSDSDSERLRFLTTTDDGFKIAEKDLELRGPGEFFGTSQSGKPDLIGESAFLSPKTVETVRKAADIIFEESQKGRAGCREYYDEITSVTRNITL